MAEEVDIGNIGGANGVASEVTLVRLVAAMESMARAQGGGMDPKKAQAILEENYKIIQASTFQQKEKNKEEKKAKEEAGRFRKAINGATKSVLSFSGAVSGQLLGSVNNFSKALFGSEDSLESFAKTVPFVGGILGSFAAILDTNLAAFRSLSESGATFGVGLNGLRLAAANAAMPLDMFVGVITENSDRMRLFGATTATAGLAFGNMSRDFRKGPGKELMNLGFTVSDINDLLLDYTEYQDRQYGVDRRNNKVSQQDLAAYGEELMLLSAVTGKQRKAIQAELTAKMQDARNAQAISKMTDDQKKNFRAAMTVGSSLGPEMSEAVTDMVDGIPKPGSVSEGLMAMSDTFARDAKNLKNMDVGAQMEFFENVKKEVEAKAGGMSEAAFQQLVDGNTSFGAALRASTELATFSAKDMKTAIANAEANMELEKKKDEALKGFQQDIIDLRSRISQIFFAEGGPMEILAAGFSKLTEFFTSEEGKETISSAMEKLANGLTTLMIAVETFIKDLAKYDIKTAIFGGAVGDEYGPKDPDTGKRKKLTEAVPGLFGGEGDSKGLGKILGEAIGTAIKMLIGDINWGSIAIGGALGAAGLAALFLLPLTGPVGIATALGTALLGIGTVAYFSGAFDPAIEAIKGWGTSIGNMWTDGKAAVVEKYNSAMDSIKGIGTSIADTWDDTTQGISNSWTRAKNNVVTMGTSIANTWDDAKEGISTKWTTAKNNVVAIGTSIANTWDDATQGISSKWTTAKDAISNLAGTIKTAWDDGTITSAWNTAKEKAMAVGSTIKTAWDDGTVTTGFNTAKEKAIAVGTIIKDAFDGTIKTAFDEAVTKVKGVGTSIKTAFDNTIVEKYTSAKTYLTDVGSKLGTSFSDIDWSKYSIKSQFTKVWDAITGFFTFDFTMPNFRDFLPTWLGGKGKSIGDKSPNEEISNDTLKSSDAKSGINAANTLQNAKAAVNSIIDIPNLKSALDTISDGMDAMKVQSYADALASVAEQLQAINEAGKDQKTSTLTRRGTKTTTTQSPAGSYLSTQSMNQNMSATELNTLNTTMTLILEELQEQSPNIKKAANRSSDVSTQVLMGRD